MVLRPLSVSVAGSENDTENKETPDKSYVQNENPVEGEDSITLENGDMIKDRLSRTNLRLVEYSCMKALNSNL